MSMPLLTSIQYWLRGEGEGPIVEPSDPLCQISVYNPSSNVSILNLDDADSLSCAILVMNVDRDLLDHYSSSASDIEYLRSRASSSMVTNNDWRYALIPVLPFTSQV